MRAPKEIAMLIGGIIAFGAGVAVSFTDDEEVAVTTYSDEKRGIVCYVYEGHGISCVYDPTQIEETQFKGDWQ